MSVTGAGTLVLDIFFIAYIINDKYFISLATKNKLKKSKKIIKTVRVQSKHGLINCTIYLEWILILLTLTNQMKACPGSVLFGLLFYITGNHN